MYIMLVYLVCSCNFINVYFLNNHQLGRSRHVQEKHTAAMLDTTLQYFRSQSNENRIRLYRGLIHHRKGIFPKSIQNCFFARLAGSYLSFSRLFIPSRRDRCSSTYYALLLIFFQQHTQENHKSRGVNAILLTLHVSIT